MNILGRTVVILSFAALTYSVAQTAPAAVLPGTLDRLVTEDAIRQQIALYGLLADGDGKNPASIRQLADKILAPDVVTDMVDAHGKNILHTVGREAVVSSTHVRDTQGPVAIRHNFVSTYFDEVTPTTAKTRSLILFVALTKDGVAPKCLTGGSCESPLKGAGSYIYHDEWRKTADGWQKSHATIYPAQ